MSHPSRGLISSDPERPSPKQGDDSTPVKEPRQLSSLLDIAHSSLRRSKSIYVKNTDSTKQGKKKGKVGQVEGKDRDREESSSGEVDFLTFLEQSTDKVVKKEVKRDKKEALESSSSHKKKVSLRRDESQRSLASLKSPRETPQETPESTPTTRSPMTTSGTVSPTPEDRFDEEKKLQQEETRDNSVSGSAVRAYLTASKPSSKDPKPYVVSCFCLTTRINCEKRKEWATLLTPAPETEARATGGSIFRGPFFKGSGSAHEPPEPARHTHTPRESGPKDDIVVLQVIKRQFPVIIEALQAVQERVAVLESERNYNNARIEYLESVITALLEERGTPTALPLSRTVVSPSPSRRESPSRASSADGIHTSETTKRPGSAYITPTSSDTVSRSVGESNSNDMLKKPTIISTHSSPNLKSRSKGSSTTSGATPSQTPAQTTPNVTPPSTPTKPKIANSQTPPRKSSASRSGITTTASGVKIQRVQIPSAGNEVNITIDDLSPKSNTSPNLPISARGRRMTDPEHMINGSPVIVRRTSRPTAARETRAREGSITTTSAAEGTDSTGHSDSKGKPEVRRLEVNKKGRTTGAESSEESSASYSSSSSTSLVSVSSSGGPGPAQPQHIIKEFRLQPVKESLHASVLVDDAIPQGLVKDTTGLKRPKSNAIVGKTIFVPDDYSDLFYGRSHTNWIAIPSDKSEKEGLAVFSVSKVVSENDTQLLLINDCRGFILYEIPSENILKIEKYLKLFFPQFAFVRLKGPQVETSIRNIEFKTRQEFTSFEVSIIYAKEGEKDPHAMFATRDHTPKFGRFLEIMGVNTPKDCVDIMWENKRVNFYIATQMTSEDQRRFIGNCQAILFFTESEAPFDPSQLLSLGAISQIFIVAQLTSTGNYRLACLHRDTFPGFEPPFYSDALIEPNMLKDYVLMKFYNGYMTARTVPPISKLYDVPRHHWIQQITKEYLQKPKKEAFRNPLIALNETP